MVQTKMIYYGTVHYDFSDIMYITNDIALPFGLIIMIIIGSMLIILFIIKIAKMIIEKGKNDKYKTR